MSSVDRRDKLLDKEKKRRKKEVEKVDNGRVDGTGGKTSPVDGSYEELQ